MAKKVILAVAGAGKTYYICQNINPSQRNLILAYTNENIKNIKNELKNLYRKIPESTTIMTFDSFVYRYLVRPYESMIGKYFLRKDFKSNGITMIEPPKRIINNKINPLYVNKGKYHYYLTKKDEYYCLRLSELILLVKTDKYSLLKKAIQRINYFYDYVFIDEFQDFRKANYEVIIKLCKKLKNVILVGDYYQHSVLGQNNCGKPFSNSSYNNFVFELKKLGFDVNDNVLAKSIRCSHDVCQFVKEKLGINIESNNNNKGKVVWVTEDNITSILEDDSILKLLYCKSKEYSFRALNWSYSKGDTVNNVCVILIKKLEKLDGDFTSINSIKVVTKNKLYVAMTRSRFNLYIIKDSIFKKFKNKYLRKI